jgi:hypothetical protein
MSSTLQAMKLAPRWLLRKEKVPYYAECCTPRGATDTPEDLKRLVTYADAERFLKIHDPKMIPHLSIGFALGPDQSGNFWQGIDLDNISQNNLDDLHAQLIGYVEQSPSTKGSHAIGYGKRFDTLGSGASGIEAYASGRFFTFTGNKLRDGPLVDLSTLVHEVLRPRHSATLRRAEQRESGTGLTEPVTEQQLADLRDALKFLNSDDRHLYANTVGMALKTVPDDKGKSLWLEWSSQSTKFNLSIADKDWTSFKPTATNWRYVFTLARQAGWKNERSSSLENDQPVDFFETKVLMEFDPDDCLPAFVASWVKAHAKASGLEAVSFAFSALPVMAAATNRTVRVNLGSGHNVPIIIWSALVGATGSGKSPAMSAAQSPLSKLHAEEARRVRHDLEAWNKQKRSERSPEPPTLKRVRYSADTTTEALTRNLSTSDGPRMLLHYDEGSGWLNDMGRYSSGGDGDRATYLSAWVGLQDYVVSRISRGETIVPELGVNILFGITPNKIKEGYKEASAEGLLGRTLICLIDRNRHVNADRSADKILLSADANYASKIESFTRIHDIEITLDGAAQAIYDDERSRLGYQSAKLESTYPGVAAMLAKAAENTARIAGLFKLCAHVDSRRGSSSMSQKWTIEIHEMLLARNFMKVAINHALAAYTGLLITDEPTAVARDCALKILRLHQNNREITEVGREQFMKVSSFKVAERNVQAAALDLLNIYHWLVENTTLRQRHSGGRFGDGTRWRINPRVFDGQFELQAQNSAADAGAVHRMLLELGMHK